jgi:hypothetical protein
VEAPRVRCVLVIADGPSRRVGASGVLIGRQDDCDLVGDDPRLSRRHALVRLTSGGAEILPVGKQPIEVNGKSFDRPAELRDGDEIKLPGIRFSVQLSAQRPAPEGPALFRLERGRGGSFGITHSPFVIGGGRGDDLIVKGWPNSALVLHVAQRELFVEVATGRAKRNDEDLTHDALEPLAPGDKLAYRDETFAITMAAHTAATTAVAPQGPGLPSRVEIDVLPRGGRVLFAMNDGDRTVFLHDRRLDLVVATAGGVPRRRVHPGRHRQRDRVASQPERIAHGDQRADRALQEGSGRGGSRRAAAPATRTDGRRDTNRARAECGGRRSDLNGRDRRVIR